MSAGRRSLRCLAALAAALLLAVTGCTSVTAGKPFDYAMAKRFEIVKGTSDKAQIAQLFGAPYETAKTATGETWTYYFREQRGGDPSDLDRTLRVDFDARGFVRDYRYTAQRKCLNPSQRHNCT